jgi:hypothetical protein
MHDMKRIIEKIPLIKNGQALLGLVFLLAGLVVTREAVFKLRELWVEFGRYFPVSLGGLALPKILEVLPLIVLVFIVFVSSVCGVLIGLLWAVSGLIDMIRSWRQPVASGDLKQPEVVAEAVRTAQAQYWRSSSWWIRGFVSLWPKARLMSPVSFEVLGDAIGYLFRLAILVLVVAAATHLLTLIPALVQRFFQASITLKVPSASPLYLTLAAMMFVNVLIGLSLVPVRKQEYFRECESARVNGSGSTSLFFALVEEACTLLNPKGSSRKPSVRLETDQSTPIRATFVESHPKALRSLARPAGYCCLPLAFLFCTMGFSRLIDFQRPVATVHWTDFLSYHLLDYVFEVIFALGLIFAGLHLAEWARRIFDIQKFRSSVVLCYARNPRLSMGSRPTEAGGGRRLTESVSWKVVPGIDEEFAQWARGEGDQGDHFEATICWADVVTEATGPRSPRFVIDMGRSEVLDEAMAKIVELPYRAHFDVDPGEERVSPSPRPDSGLA